ncbi:hypothetical protein D3C81_1883220 [compost metagenome]
MPGKGTKQIRVGRIEAYLQAMLEDTRSMFVDEAEMTERDKGILEGRRIALTGVVEYLGLKSHCDFCGELSQLRKFYILNGSTVVGLCPSCVEWKGEQQALATSV